MKTVLELLRMPLIKIIGISIVLYFGLLANKKDPDSLGNRLSPDQIKQNVAEVKKKSGFILSSISTANQRNVGSAQEAFDSEQDFSPITVEDVVKGGGESEVKCGDEVKISYDIRVATSENSLEAAQEENLIIGSNKNALLERKIIGMRSGGVRIINIPRHFKSTNQKLGFLLKFNEANLQYNITLLNVHAVDNKNLKCSPK